MSKTTDRFEDMMILARWFSEETTKGTYSLNRLSGLLQSMEDADVHHLWLALQDTQAEAACETVRLELIRRQALFSNETIPF